MQYIEKKTYKTKNRVLFNSLLVNSVNYVKVILYYNNGFRFKVFPIENTQLNKFLMRL